MPYSKELITLLQDIEAESKKLAGDRLALLETTIQETRSAREEMGQVNLLFVCTHNSRRSHFADFWAQVFLEHYGVFGVQCSSCGTEATECNPRTVASLERSGFQLQSDQASENPQYVVELADSSKTLFSKAFGNPSLPTENVVAMMCCDDADTKCPVVPGAISRVSLHYLDPKASDGSESEAATYDERSYQIAAEMAFLMRGLGK
ncbi:MAG: protein-tyrosine-phosphatase [Planctomycetota bacterium]